MKLPLQISVHFKIAPLSSAIFFFLHIDLVFLISNARMSFPAWFLQHFHICSRDGAGRVLFPTVLCQLVAHSAAFLRKLAARRRNWRWFLFSRQNSLFLPSALFSSDQNVKQEELNIAGCCVTDWMQEKKKNLSRISVTMIFISHSPWKREAQCEGHFLCCENSRAVVAPH